MNPATSTATKPVNELAYIAENESIFSMLRKAKRAWQADVASGATNLGYAEWYCTYNPATLKGIMKDQNIKIQIEQLGIVLRDEVNRELDTERNCRLQDAQELLRQAWHIIDGSPCEANDLTTATLKG